jgi:hypothetical protein
MNWFMRFSSTSRVRDRPGWFGGNLEDVNFRGFRTAEQFLAFYGVPWISIGQDG